MLNKRTLSYLNYFTFHSLPVPADSLCQISADCYDPGRELIQMRDSRDSRGEGGWDTANDGDDWARYSGLTYSTQNLISLDLTAFNELIIHFGGLLLLPMCSWKCSQTPKSEMWETARKSIPVHKGMLRNLNQSRLRLTLHSIFVADMATKTTTLNTFLSKRNT